MPSKTIRLFNLTNKDVIIVGLQEVDGGYLITAKNAELIAQEIHFLQESFAFHKEGMTLQDYWRKLVRERWDAEQDDA